MEFFDSAVEYIQIIHWKDYLLVILTGCFLYWVLRNNDLGNFEFQLPVVVVIFSLVVSGVTGVSYYPFVERVFDQVPFIAWWIAVTIFVFLISVMFDGKIKKNHIIIALTASLLTFCVTLIFSIMY
jgi:hypothetical protein